MHKQENRNNFGIYTVVERITSSENYKKTVATHRRILKLQLLIVGYNLKLWLALGSKSKVKELGTSLNYKVSGNNHINSNEWRQPLRISTIEYFKLSGGGSSTDDTTMSRTAYMFTVIHTASCSGEA